MTAPSFSEEQLTAYALGELSPEERFQVETELAANPQLQAELKAIQTLASQLRVDLRAEIPAVAEGLTPEETAAPSETGSDKIISFRQNPWLYAGGLLAAAACAALMAWPTFSLNSNAAKKDSRPAVSVDEVSVATSVADDAPPAEISKEEMSGEPLAATSPQVVSAPAAPASLSPETESSLEQSLAKNAHNEVAKDKLKQVYETEKSSTMAQGSSVVADAATSSSQSMPAVLMASSQAQPSAKPANGLAGLASTDSSSTRSAPRDRSSLSSKTTGYYADGDSLRSEPVFYTAIRRANTAPTAGESYEKITDNAFLQVSDQALSTFSVDVDTGSYSNLRRFLNQNQLPPKNAVRIEELVNYFNYNYPQPKGKDPFSVTTEVAHAPWNYDHLLVRIGLQGKTVTAQERPTANLVFLIDVSGSMNEPNKLPLVIDSLKLLVQKLKPEDRVGIAVYAGNSGMVLPSTPVSRRGEILKALSALQAGGSTNGAMGIQLAYDMAKAHFIEGGINRVILCTDGDFNVGITDHDELMNLISEKAKSKVFLSVFGFGMGNLQDATLEQLADKGNGNYGYIDNAAEAKRVFVEKLSGTLQTIAKDVKIQVEFNPAVISSYRLIGYENRMLAAQDFNDDKKDAGEIGAGLRVTALYELIPVGIKEDKPSVDALKYQKPLQADYAGDKSEIMNIKLRYKQPEGDVSKLIQQPVKNQDVRSFALQKTSWWRSAPEEVSTDFQFAAGVAAFGMILRDSPYKGNADIDMVLRLSGKGSSDDLQDRKEFIGLVNKAKSLMGENSKAQRE